MAEISPYASGAILTALRHTTAILTLLALVFQFGACPCGCLEHNGWLQLIGLQSPDQVPAAAESNQLTNIGTDDHHECDGNGKPSYLCNARLISSATAGIAISHVVALGGAIGSGDPLVRCKGRSSPSSIRGRAVSRAESQVYRL